MLKNIFTASGNKKKCSAISTFGSAFKRGFTIVELIVVIGIMAVVMSVVMFNQSGLNSSILITNLSYEMALAVRQAQTFGVGVRSKDTNSGDFSGGYGIVFSVATPNQFLIFNDKNKDLSFTPNSSEEVSLYTFQNQKGNFIQAVCVNHTAGPCNTSAPSYAPNGVNIVFVRPNPEAQFSSNGVQINGPIYIVVNTPNKKNCRAVIVEASGQVRVDTGANNVCTNS
jgi:prepilin-type N-terminal cleavage/methylation domain-containing protein